MTEIISQNNFKTVNSYFTLEIRNEINKYVEMMKKAFDCSAVYLFGSYVYGVPNEHSDFDFFVIYNDSSLRSKDVCIGLRQILAPVKKERPVDIVACSKESFERNPDSSIIKRTVIQKGLLLYDGSKNFS